MAVGEKNLEKKEATALGWVVVGVGVGRDLLKTVFGTRYRFPLPLIYETVSFAGEQQEYSGDGEHWWDSEVGGGGSELVSVSVNGLLVHWTPVVGSPQCF